MTAAQVFALVVFLIAYALIATERVHKVTAALSGAGVMLAFGVTDGPTAFHSEEAGIDWNVIFLLLGASRHAAAPGSASGSSPGTGLVVAALSVLLAGPYRWLRYFVMA